MFFPLSALLNLQRVLWSNSEKIGEALPVPDIQTHNKEHTNPENQ